MFYKRDSFASQLSIHHVPSNSAIFEPKIAKQSEFVYSLHLLFVSKYLTSICSQVQIHDKDDYADLHKFIAPEALPKRYGGKLSMEEARDKDFVERLLSKKSYYEGNCKYQIRD